MLRIVIARARDDDAQKQRSENAELAACNTLENKALIFSLRWALGALARREKYWRFNSSPPKSSKAIKRIDAAIKHHDAGCSHFAAEPCRRIDAHRSPRGLDAASRANRGRGRDAGRREDRELRPA